MKCPKCQTTVAAQASWCPSCPNDLKEDAQWQRALKREWIQVKMIFFGVLALLGYVIVHYGVWKIF